MVAFDHRATDKGTWKRDAFQIIALKRKAFETHMRAIRNQKCRVHRVSIIHGNSVTATKSRRAISRPSKMPDVLSRIIVLYNKIQSVTIGHIDIAVGWVNGGLGWLIAGA